jgi:flagellar secretion chaperone FliS
MTNPTRTAVDAYHRLEVETGIAAASPQRLVVMLYDGAIKAIHAARTALAANDVAVRGAAVSRAVAIIDEGLRAALDMQSGGEIAANLAALYDYIVSRLLYANLKQDMGSLDEAARLLCELRGAWEALERPSQAPSAEPQPPQERRAAMSYGRV